MALRILVSGANGFIGSALTRALTERGDQVVCLTRGAGRGGAIHWDPSAGELDAADVEGFDAVVHLAGEPIAGLWTAKKKAAILSSRRVGTRLLTEALAGAQSPPAAFVSSSAVGIYGSRADQLLTEDVGVGEGFLAEVVSTWEEAAAPARAAGIRVTNLRLGLVTAQSGGMMGPIKPLFKAGLGGKLGDGSQWWSWVTLEDVVRAFIHAVDTPEMTGPYNVAAPNPVTNAEFTKALARAFHRPAVLPAPKFALRAAARGMADEMLLASQRVDSSKLVETGFEFGDPELEPALGRIFA